MRLLNTDNLEVVLIREDAIPLYAILSHTWGANEISLQDITSLKACDSQRNTQNFKKIFGAAKLAASDGYQWIWVDTCCIDKTSSAELSESINSMYRWYENASVCYVYIEDYTSTWGLPNTRWTTRGWTFQELIAPRVVRFYNKDWNLLGEKREPSVCEALTRATGIEAGVLLGQITVTEVSVANRMKWASKRLTTRPEDVAYCLMGLFGVNMPLLYGEGGVRAFIRLQEQILKTTDDQSIFAWQLQSQKEDENMYGLLATTPSYFEDIPSIYLMPTGFQSTSSVPWSMTNKGLNVQLYIRPGLDATEEEYLVILDCFQDLGESDDGLNNRFQAYSPAIHLRRLWGDQYTRIRAHVCESVGERARHGGFQETFFVKQSPDSKLPSVLINDYPGRGPTVYNWKLREVFPLDMWNSRTKSFRLSRDRVHEIQGMFRFRRNQEIGRFSANFELEDESLDVAVVLHRTARADLEAVCFPRLLEGSTVAQAYFRLNRLWTKAPGEDQDRLFGEYQERIRAVPEMIKTVRAGRGLYLLNIHQDFERQVNIVCQELEDRSLDKDCFKQLEAQLSSPFEFTTPAPLKKLVDDELESILEAVDIWPHPESHDFRQRLEGGAKDIANVVVPSAVDICSAVINGNRQEVDSLLNCVNDSERKPVSTFEGFHLIHIATFTPDPRIMSALLEKGLDPLVVTDRGLNAFQLASICGKVEMLATLLQLAPKAEGNQTLEIGYEDPSYDKAVSRFRPYFGSEAHLQDTALHLAAVSCSAQEFESILEEILKATRIPISDWTSSEINLEREYLVCLRNCRGETALHRAAAVANRQIVRLICETMPRASARLDSTGRPALWYAAYGGDQEIAKLIAGACSSCLDAPILHLSDDNGMTPLHVACCGGHSNCVKELLTLGATLTSTTRELGLTPIHCAALLGEDDCLGIMVDEARRKARRRLWKVTTLLDLRASKGPMELFAPIHLAAANGWLKCVRVLALNMASTTAKSRFYYVLSHGDLKHGMEGTSQGLVEVDPSTPAEIARKEGHEAVCRYLENLQPSSLSSPPSVNGRAKTAPMGLVSSLEDWN